MIKNNYYKIFALPSAKSIFVFIKRKRKNSVLLCSVPFSGLSYSTSNLLGVQRKICAKQRRKICLSGGGVLYLWFVAAAVVVWYI